MMPGATVAAALGPVEEPVIGPVLGPTDVAGPTDGPTVDTPPGIWPWLKGTTREPHATSTSVMMEIDAASLVDAFTRGSSPCKDSTPPLGVLPGAVSP
jgi:hypothetical protein